MMFKRGGRRIYCPECKQTFWVKLKGHTLDQLCEIIERHNTLHRSK